MLASTCSMRRSIEPRENDLSRELTALNRLPSIATIAWAKRFRLRHSATNCRQAERIAGPLSLRKSAIVLKSGVNRPVSHIISTLRAVSRSRIGRGTRLRIVDAILTGVHQPGESHFELMKAFANDDRLARIGAAAEERGYRSHEFGDSLLIDCGEEEA